MNVHPSNVDASGLFFGVVVSRFNHLISAMLLEGCHDALVRHGASEDAIDVAWVPGAFEIPMAARAMAESGRYAAIVTLGSVIRGGTPHFDYVCVGVTDGVREVMRDTGVPVAFGVLTTDDVEQALARSGGEMGNKGSEVALAAVEMARLRERARQGARVEMSVEAEMREAPRSVAGSARRRAREVALQVLYAVDLATGRPRPDQKDPPPHGPASRQPTPPAPDPDGVFEAVESHFEMPAPARAFAHELTRGVCKHIDRLDETIAAHSRHWRIERMAAVDRNVLRLATFELIQTDTPTAVVLDEAVDLARRFGGDGSPAFVNGILDAIARDAREPSS